MIVPYGTDLEIKETPYATYGLIAVNIIIHAFVETLNPDELRLLFMNWGFSAFEFAVPRILSSMFLHGDMFHLIGNMMFLWIYGPGVERALTSVGFAAYYLFFGVAADLMHWACLKVYMIDIPCVGASGAISGVMGAFFVIYPAAKIRHCLIFMPRFQFSLPAWIVLGYWFILQMHGASTETNSSVGFFAHIGGFLAGFIITTYLKFGGDFRRAFAKARAHRAIDEAQNLPDDMDPRVALASLKELLDETPDNPNLRYWYVVMAMRANRTEAVNRAFDTILPSIPDSDPPARLNGYLMQSRHVPISHPDAAMELSRLFDESKHVQEAYDTITSFLSKYPETPKKNQFRYKMAETMIKLERSKEAKIIFEDLAKGDKRDPIVQAADYELKKLSMPTTGNPS